MMTERPKKITISATAPTKPRRFVRPWSVTERDGAYEVRDARASRAWSNRRAFWSAILRGKMMAKLDSQRVAQIYEKLTGRRPVHGSWNIERRNFAQKIVYIDEACRAVLSAIADIENAKPDADISQLEKALRTEFGFLNTLQE
jgi:hypothetical protein